MAQGVLGGLGAFGYYNAAVDRENETARQNLQGVLSAGQVINQMQTAPLQRQLLQAQVQNIPVQQGALAASAELHRAQAQKALAEQRRQSEFQTAWDALDPVKRSGQEGKDLLTKFYPEKATPTLLRPNGGAADYVSKTIDAARAALASGDMQKHDLLMARANALANGGMAQKWDSLRAMGYSPDVIETVVLGNSLLDTVKNPDGSTSFVSKVPAVSGVLGRTQSAPSAGVSGVLSAPTGDAALEAIRQANARGVTGVQISVPPGAPEPTWPVAGQPAAQPTPVQPAAAIPSPFQPSPAAPGEVLRTAPRNELKSEEFSVNKQNVKGFRDSFGRYYGPDQQPVSGDVKPAITAADRADFQKRAVEQQTLSVIGNEIAMLKKIIQQNPQSVAGPYTPITSAVDAAKRLVDPNQVSPLARAEQLKNAILTKMVNIGRITKDDAKRIDSQFSLGFGMNNSPELALKGLGEIEAAMSARQAGVNAASGRTSPGGGSSVFDAADAILKGQ